MRQLQLFTTAEVAGMRDRTASRRYSPGREAFRRDHERRRAWGLKRRHAERLHRSRTAASESSHAPPAGESRTQRPSRVRHSSRPTMPSPSSRGVDHSHPSPAVASPPQQPGQAVPVAVHTVARPARSLPAKPARHIPRAEPRVIFPPGRLVSSERLGSTGPAGLSSAWLSGVGLCGAVAVELRKTGDGFGGPRRAGHAWCCRWMSRSARSGDVGSPHLPESASAEAGQVWCCAVGQVGSENAGYVRSPPLHGARRLPRGQFGRNARRGRSDISQGHSDVSTRLARATPTLIFPSCELTSVVRGLGRLRRKWKRDLAARRSRAPASTRARPPDMCRR